MEGLAIEARSLSIAYRRYLKRMTTLKSAVLSMFQGTNYEKFWALRQFDLTVKKGERLGIIGANGSGKSTLLKAIAGVLPPTEGKMFVDGRVAPLLELGGGFRPDLTGRENIFLNGAIMGLSQEEMEERYDRIADFAAIGDFIDSPLSTYSSGMRARLGFAVASDVDPDILLLDEILAVGDARFKDKAMARTRGFFDTAMTVIVVSHTMNQIKDLCTRVIWLQKGTLMADGTPDEVIAQYLASAKNGS